MIGHEQRLREAQPVGGRVLRGRGQESRRGERHLVLRLQVFAPVQHEGFARLVVAHDHHAGDFLLAILLRLLLQVLDLLRRRVLGGDAGPDLRFKLRAESACQLLALRRTALVTRDAENGREVGRQRFAVRRVGIRRQARDPRGEGEFKFLLHLPVGLGGLQLRLVRREPLLVVRVGQFDERRGDALGAGAAAGKAVLRNLIERGHQPVIIALRERVVFVVVALRAGQGQPQPGRGRRVHAVEEDVEALLLGDGPTLAVEQVVAIEARGNELVVGRLGQQVARELLDGESVKRHVRVQRAHHPITPHPLKRVAVLLEAIAVRIARGIEPRQRHALAVVRRLHQPVHQPLVSIRRGVCDKGIHLLRFRGKADQVQRQPANECPPIGFGRRR